MYTAQERNNSKSLVSIIVVVKCDRIPREQSKQQKKIVTKSRKVTTEVKPCNTHVHQEVGLSPRKKNSYEGNRENLHGI